MKIGNKLKKLISLLAVLIILVSCCVTPAHADILSYSQRQRLGSMIASALMALNITLNSVVAPYQDMLDTIPDALGLPSATWDNEYLDRSTVQIWKDYVEIDGVQYSDVWFSTEAAEKFRTDGYDFKTAYSLVSNSNGTFVSGTGEYDGIPIYDDNGTLKSQIYGIPNTVGDGQTGITQIAQDSYKVWYEKSDQTTYTTSQGRSADRKPYQLQLQRDNQTWRAYFYNYYNGYLTQWERFSIGNNDYVSQPFDFDWVSGQIPADEELPDGTGMMIRVPTDEIQDWINDNPTMVNTPINVDVTLDPTITTKIDDLIDLIIPVLANLQVGDITFVENHTEPTPPVQDTLLPDTWWSQVSQKFDQVINAIQHFDLQPVIQSISTIPSAITQAVSNITQAISNLGDQIIQDIEQGPIKVFDKALDKLRDIFLPILISLKSALGIWHYVVEWMGNISATLTWYVTAFSGISSTLMSPIYAVIAGWIVIMVYRRFGR